MLNGLGKTFQVNNESLYTNINCELENIKDLTNEINLLLFYGFIVLVACILILVPFYLYLDIMVNRFWNHIRTSTHESYFELKQSLTDRLSLIHGQYNLDSDTKKAHSKMKANYKHPWRFLWRVSIYIVITLAMFLLNYFFLYKNCSDVLYKRPVYLRNLINDQFIFRTMEVWAYESLLEYSGISLQYKLPAAFFESPKARFNEIFALTKHSSLSLRESKYRELFNDEFTDIMFKKSVTSYNKLVYGLYAARNIVSLEAGVLSDPMTLASPDLTYYWFSLADGSDFVDSELEKLIKILDSTSLEIISNTIDHITIVLVIYVFVSISLYMLVYLPFLKNEKRNLIYMEKILEIVPQKKTKRLNSNINGEFA